MEETGAAVFSLSDLIRCGRPLTAASSLVPSRQISTRVHPKISNHNHPLESSSPACQSPIALTLKPLNQPTVLIGTFTLPSFVAHSSSISCSCFQFSDDSSNVCCEVLDFDPKMIGMKIRVLAWNFIPFKCKDRGMKRGFLEIIGWELFHACSETPCSLSDFSSVCFALGACGFKDNREAGGLIFGVMDSISPVFATPCSSGGGGTKSIRAFLVNVLVCECKFCNSKFVASELRTLSEKNIKDHCFSKRVDLYFSGLASSWHPVVSRFIGDIVVLSGLKKKIVFITEGDSRLMHVTTDIISLHIAMSFKERTLAPNADVREKGQSGSYTGVITGVYMQGMVVELDQDVILLLTDQHIAVPHYVRAGAIVTLKNVHFVDPKFPWGKMLILGACCRTSVHVESFSPLEAGLHLKTQSQSPLQKFINTLPFAARLWALLVVSCFRKKFTGILSDKEILGTKNMEGLAQKYATWHLPPSAFLLRHGVLVEFCKHDFCSGVRDEHSGHLRLVLPIANLICYCENSWKDVFKDDKSFSDYVGGTNQNRVLTCGGRSFVQSIRRAMHSEEIGVLLLGTSKISSISGRLQLVDATGCLDMMLDHPATLAFDGIFEAKDFTLIMEGIPSKLVDLDSSIYRPLSCRSVFSCSVPARRTDTYIYLYHSLSDVDFRSRSLFFDWKRNYQELDSGKFHLLMLTHKFPVQQMFQGDLAKVSNMFAQATVLPWDLLVTEKYEDAVTGMHSSAQHGMDSLENYSEPGKFLSLKSCRNKKAAYHDLKDHGNGLNGHCSSYTINSCDSSQLLEFPCLIASKGANFCLRGCLQSMTGCAKTKSDCEAPSQQVFLEFSPESFCTYGALKIGHFYLLRHQEEDVLCSMKENSQINHAKVFVGSKICLWSFTLSSIESLRISDASNNEIFTKECWPSEVPCSTAKVIANEIYADNKVFVPSSAVKFLSHIFPISDGDPMEPRDSFEEELDILDHIGPMANESVQSLGNSYSDCPLPQGDLITLSGLVVALHDVKGDAFPALFKPTPCEGYLPMCLQRNGGVCIHVLADHETVRIFCDTTKNNYPTGLGQDAYATFHQILVLSEQNYMMLPASFITVNNINPTNKPPSGEFKCSSGNVGSSRVASSDTVPVALLSDALHMSELKQMQFCCRLVGVYVLVLEKGRATSIFQSSISSIPPVRIPFLGFFIDDGSLSCCCWTNFETAATLLHLECRESLLEYPVEAFGSTRAGTTRVSHTSTVSRLSKILDSHGRIVVKNCGPVFDPSYQDLAFFADSGRLVSSSDEDMLRSMIAYAVVSTSWTITGSIMDPENASWLEARLSEVDMAIPPLLNIWATSVCQTDMLKQARNIIQGLV